jgi:hypothetical protein
MCVSVCVFCDALSSLVWSECMFESAWAEEKRCPPLTQAHTLDNPPDPPSEMASRDMCMSRDPYILLVHLLGYVASSSASLEPGCF